MGSDIKFNVNILAGFFLAKHPNEYLCVYSGTTSPTFFS